jgi:hypothetical protein
MQRPVHALIIETLYHDLAIFNSEFKVARE